MSNYYFDLESDGLNPNINKILTLQYQEIDSFTGKPKGNLIILKEWESSEEQIVKEIHKKIVSNNVWGFILCGCNLIYDLTFLFNKFKKYNLPSPSLEDYLFKNPQIDIKSTLILANGMSFKGSGLDQMSKKQSDGRDIPKWYHMQDYERIEAYIIQETESFMEIFQKILDDLKELKKKLK